MTKKQNYLPYFERIDSQKSYNMVRICTMNRNSLAFLKKTYRNCMRRKPMKKTLSVLILAFTASCAMSSQDAVISIFPQVNSSNIGESIPLSISVEDSRSSNVIGTYGNSDTNSSNQDIERTIEDSRSTDSNNNFGNSPQIYTTQDLARTIGVALVDSFSKMGFNIADSNSSNAVRLNVYLEELNYTIDSGTIKTDVETKSRVRVEAINKGYNRTFSNSEQRTVPFSATAESNNSQLSNTLNTTIQRIVDDSDLINALKN